MFGALGEIRTPNILITKQAFYRLELRRLNKIPHSLRIYFVTFTTWLSLPSWGLTLLAIRYFVTFITLRK